MDDIEKSLPFTLLGADSDNGGEPERSGDSLPQAARRAKRRQFINHHLVRCFHEREKPILFTRSRPCHKNDNAHVEQRNATYVRARFGHDRYDNPAVVPLINALCKGELGQFNNHFLSTHKLKEKRRNEKKNPRIYGPAQTPYARVLQAPEVDQKTKTKLRAEHAALNPFELSRKIHAQQKVIEATRGLST